MKHIFKSQYVLAIAVAIVMLAAVGCKQKKSAPTETGFELSMTNADSTAVVQLVDQFFGYAENECYTEAAAMLSLHILRLIRSILNRNLSTMSNLV